MPKHGKMRHGSLQFYPRVRAKKILPRVSWSALSKEEPGLLGFIGYKVGMKSAYVQDSTPNSLSKGQKITIPVTIIECPTLKIFSVRFYKNKKLIGEVINSSVDKEMKKKVKVPKGKTGSESNKAGSSSKDAKSRKIDDFKDYEDIRVLVYSQVKKTNIKKTPDIAEAIHVSRSPSHSSPGMLGMSPTLAIGRRMRFAPASNATWRDPARFWTETMLPPRLMLPSTTNWD